MKYAAYYFAAINVITFLLYGIDKRRAKRHQRRIPERTLFLLPLLGGSIGGIGGMLAFRHKTKHWYFCVGLPLILLGQLALAAWLLR